MATLYAESGYYDKGYVYEAIEIDWATKTIIIPRGEMLLLQSAPIEIRQLNLDDFRKRLRDLEDDEQGMVFPVTHNYAQPTNVGGVTLASVVEILDPYTVTFEDGAYAVNIVGGNTNLADKVNINNVGVRTTNSAGLQDLAALQASSFDNQSVAFKSSSIYGGTTYPVGTRAYPCNNLPDTWSIAKQRGFSRIVLLDSAHFNFGLDFSGMKILGDNTITVTATLGPETNVLAAEFERCAVQGTLDGFNVFEKCRIKDVVYVSGVLHNCALEGTIELAAGADLLLTDCYESSFATPTMDVMGANNLALRSYSGDIRIVNCTGTSNVELDIEQGHVHIEPSCTGGTITIRGNAVVTDNSNGSVVTDQTLNYSLNNINVGSVNVDTASLAKQINRSVQAAIPSPPSSSAIWDAAPRWLKKAPAKGKDYSDEIRKINNKLDGLYQSVKEARQSTIERPSARFDDSGLQREIQKVAAAIAAIEIPDGQESSRAVKELVQPLKSQLDDVQIAVLGLREDVRELPEVIEKPDLTGLATKQEVSALKALVEKLDNYDDAEALKALQELASIANGIVNQAARVDQKVDLVLDNQLQLNI